jgi:hypothetical protein
VNAPQIAVDRFAGVNKVAARAGGTERRRNFLSDEPSLSHARHDDISLTPKHQVDGATEVVMQVIGQSQNRLAFRAENLTSKSQLLELR